MNYDPSPPPLEKCLAWGSYRAETCVPCTLCTLSFYGSVSKYFVCFRILQTAEMLKPPMPTSHRNEECIEYFPHIVFVQNKSFYSDFSIEQIKTIQVRN